MIADVVGDLVAQRYGPPGQPAYELVLLDAGSSDGTAELATRAAAAAKPGEDRPHPFERADRRRQDEGGGAASRHARICRRGGRSRVRATPMLESAADFLAAVMAAWSGRPGRGGHPGPRRHPSTMATMARRGAGGGAADGPRQPVRSPARRTAPPSCVATGCSSAERHSSALGVGTSALSPKTLTCRRDSWRWVSTSRWLPRSWLARRLSPPWVTSGHSACGGPKGACDASWSTAPAC